MQIKIELEIGVSPALMALIEMASNGSFGDRVPPTSRPSPKPFAGEAERVQVGAENIEVADTAPAGDPNEVDAHGWPWSAELHASTRGTTKDGLWRMKVGVSRPDPKPGFPKDAGTTGTTENGAASAASGTASSPAAGSGDDEDEFAAFRDAAAKANATDTTAAATVAARKWTDADLGALCNQAAVKLGDPAPVKALIAGAVPSGAVPHSRNIPEDQREAFAQAVEKAAGIEFAG